MVLKRYVRYRILLGSKEFEMICKEMASGFPLLTTIRTGKGFHSLKSNEIYVPPNEKQIVEGKSEGLHAIMLFGGGMGKGRLRFYRFVNTHSEDFCKLCTPRKDGLKGGFGNVIADAILIQPVKFHRAGKGDHRPAELLEPDKLTHAAPGNPRFIRERICWSAATSCQGYKFLAQETRTVRSAGVIDVGSLMQVRPKILSLYLRDQHGQTLGHFSVPELTSCLESGYFGTNLIIHVAYATPDALFLVLEDVTPDLWAKSPSEGFITAKSSRMPEVSHVRSAYLEMGPANKNDSETEAENHFLECLMHSDMQNPRAETSCGTRGMSEWNGNAFGTIFTCGSLNVNVTTCLAKIVKNVNGRTRGPWQAYLCKLLKLYESTYAISQVSVPLEIVPGSQLLNSNKSTMKMKLLKWFV